MLQNKLKDLKVNGENPILNKRIFFTPTGNFCEFKSRQKKTVRFLYASYTPRKMHKEETLQL